jgi:hypothetical protein
MRVLRRTGDDLKWSAKLESEWDGDDRLHKNAMYRLSRDIFELAVTRQCYIDRETLLKMYDMYMTYDPTVVPQWRQNETELFAKIMETVD